jgi:ABC-type antimicrobial peptide transport system permease subunit
LPLGIVVLRFLSTSFLLPFPKASALSVLIAPLVLAVTALATWIPALTASRTAPNDLLRTE